ncbi:MAG: crotonase/enoyl-CoA hydratase family protein [Candidatus Binatia bacterium]
MSTLVTYSTEEGVATIAMDDGKRNALSSEMLAELNAAFDRALAEKSPVILTGRPETFSAGFDLKVMMAGGAAAASMVLTGFELGERLMQFPTPVVVACNGNAIAMGAFLLLSSDYRVGTAGPYRVVANEVALGITMPYFAIEICRQRLTPQHFNRAVNNSEVYGPEDAVVAGWLDRVVPAADLVSTARSIVGELMKLNAAAHAATKLRSRAVTLKAIRTAIEADRASFRTLFGA